MLKIIITRIYQSIIKIGMYLLPRPKIKVIKGNNSLDELSQVLLNRHNKFLIVTGKNVSKLPLVRDFINSIDPNRYHIFYHTGFEPNDLGVLEGVKIYQKTKCQAIVALGGGTVIDLAKIIGAKVARPNLEISKMQGLFKILKPIPDLYAIPTTAGTGSEATMSAVITIEKTKRKAPITDMVLLPKYAILNPLLTVNLPQDLTAYTALDALTHALEAYTNARYNTKYENELCVKAIKLILNNIEVAYHHGNNIEARENLLLASFYAGQAFSRGCVGYVHALGHPLSSLYGLHHGYVMAVLLPKVMKNYGKKVYVKLAFLSDELNLMDKNKSNKEKAINFINLLEELNQRLDIANDVKLIEKNDQDKIIRWAMQESNLLYPTPQIWNKENFKDLIKDLIK